MIFDDLCMKYADCAHLTGVVCYKNNSNEFSDKASKKPLLATLALAFSMAICALPADAARPAGAKQQTGVVSRVVDGDTLWLARASGGKPLKVRMTGIDAPEICQAGGVAARDALAGKVLGKSVVIAVPTARSRDDYGRVLAAVELNGDDIGRWMVRSGQAWSYGYKKRPGPYAAEQLLARTARRGVFADNRAEEPRIFRKRNGSCYAYGHQKSAVLQ